MNESIVQYKSNKHFSGSKILKQKQTLKDMYKQKEKMRQPKCSKWVFNSGNFYTIRMATHKTSDNTGM